MNVFASEVEAILSSFQCSATVLYHDTAVARVQEWTSSDGPLKLEKRLFLKGVSDRDLARAKNLAEGLGLSTGMVAALCMMAGLDGVALRPDLSRLIVLELSEFRRALHERAVIAAEDLLEPLVQRCALDGLQKTEHHNWQPCLLHERVLILEDVRIVAVEADDHPRHGHHAVALDLLHGLD